MTISLSHSASSGLGVYKQALRGLFIAGTSNVSTAFVEINSSPLKIKTAFTGATAVKGKGRR